MDTGPKCHALISLWCILQMHALHSPLCDCILECAAHPAWGKHPSLPWGRETFLLFSLSVAGTRKRQGWLSAWQLGEAAWVFPLC